MEGQAIFSDTYKWKAKVKTLAASRTIKITEDQTIDPALLFLKIPRYIPIWRAWLG